MPMGSNLSQAPKAFNIFRLLESEAMEMFNIGEQSQSKSKFLGTEVCEAAESSIDIEVIRTVFNFVNLFIFFIKKILSI